MKLALLFSAALDDRKNGAFPWLFSFIETDFPSFFIFFWRGLLSDARPSMPNF